jgi:hypothetical protein
MCAQRFLLVATFAAPTSFPDGSTYSLLPELEGRFTLRSLREGSASCRST